MEREMDLVGKPTGEATAMTERTSEQASESQEKSAARPPKEAQAKSGEESAVETTGRSRGARQDFTVGSIPNGLPAGVQQVVVSMGMLTLTSIVNRFGSAVMAAFGVGGRLDQFAFMPAMSVGLSVTALVGQNLGAGLHERVKETVKWAAYLTVGITSVVSLVVLVMPGVLISIFNSEPGVLIEGAAYLRIVGSAYVPYALMFMLSGVLRGAGDTVPSMFISLVTLWLVRIPVAAYLSGLMGSRGIWLAIAISPVIGASLNYAYFRSGRWKNKTVVSSRSVPQPSTEAES
ncbi:MAG TPA: hypothetical protein GXX23_01155 [Firmicutes bacterium]|nr:hypothetical protein [Candidatus Fermentithermobacillaceae bacterium]